MLFLSLYICLYFHISVSMHVCGWHGGWISRAQSRVSSIILDYILLG